MLGMLVVGQLLGGDDEPNDITPMAWNTPLLIVSRGVLKVPLDSAGTRNPCVTTVIRITPMLINANVLAFASCTSQSSSPRT
jgi:hypothetical protein